MLAVFLLLAGCGGGGGGSGSKLGSGNSSNKPSSVKTSIPANQAGQSPAVTSSPVSEADQSASVNSDSRSVSSNITWLPPTQNVDDSAFTDLVGYKLYIGSEPGRFEIVRELQEPGLTEYVLEDLPAGTYYVGMTAVNTQNIESPLSNVVVRVVGGS